MYLTPKALMPYLQPSSPGKGWARDRLVDLLTNSAAFPAFSAGVSRLSRMAGDDNTGMDELADIIEREPGLALNCIRASGKMKYGSVGVVRCVKDSVMRLGTKEIRRVAISLGAMSRFNHLKVTVNWDRFWLHSLLVARLSDQIARAFRQASGMEYLAGLLHDAGKLVLEHYFPREFEQVLQRAWYSRRGHFIAEREVLGIDHAQIGAALCHALQLHPHVRTGVWYHHMPTDESLLEVPGGDKGFLAAVIGFADALAHKASDAIGGERATDTPYDELPEWALLLQFEPVHGLELDTEQELAAAEADLKAFTA